MQLLNIKDLSTFDTQLAFADLQKGKRGGRYVVFKDGGNIKDKISLNQAMNHIGTICKSKNSFSTADQESVDHICKTLKKLHHSLLDTSFKTRLKRIFHIFHNPKSGIVKKDPLKSEKAVEGLLRKMKRLVSNNIINAFTRNKETQVDSTLQPSVSPSIQKQKAITPPVDTPWVPLKSYTEESGEDKLYYQERIYDYGPFKFLKKGEHYLDLVELKSSNQSRGFGTLCYQKYVKEAISLNLQGHQILTSASWTSQLFHLYMGMQPEPRCFGMLISTLLKYHRAYPGKKFPTKDDHIDFGCYTMTMSEIGLNRWKEAIESQTPFKLFKNLEHLKDNLSKYRQEREKQLIAENEKKTNNPSYFRYRLFEDDYPLLEENALDEIYRLVNSL